MKNISLRACSGALSLRACDSKSGAETRAATRAATTEATGCGEVAYVQVEAVLAQSDLFLTEGAALQAKTEKAQKSWAQKEQNLQYEAAQLQEKYQKGLITTNATMREAGRALEGCGFFRCNKGYLVNLEHVDAIREHNPIAHGDTVQVSRARKKAFLDALNNYLGEVSK